MFLWLTVGLVVIVKAQPPELPSGAFSRADDGSLRFSLRGFDGLMTAQMHFSVNKPLSGVQAGDYFAQLNSNSDGTWTYSNNAIQVKTDDVINYWLNFLTARGGYNNLNLSSRIGGAPVTTASTSSSTTRRTTTRASTTRTTTSRTPSNDTNTASPIQPTTPTTPGAGCSSYPCVVFEDEFDTFDMKKWQHEITASGGGNWEFQVYVNNRSNSWTQDGALHIRPTLTSDIYGEPFLSNGILDLWGGSTPASACTQAQFYGCFRQGTGANYINPIHSARVRTANSFTMKYGKVEVEAKLPKGDWLWPAIWMLPVEEHYGVWPASGEIDIVEGRGNTNYKDSKGKQFGTKWIAQTLHWGPRFGLNAYLKTHAEKVVDSGDFTSDFHKYAVEWNDQQIIFSVDDEEILTVDPGDDGFWKFGEFDKLAPGTFNPWANDGGRMAPFDREFYIIINLAVGGTGGFFPDTAVNSPYPKPWNDMSQTAAREFWMAKANWYPTWKFPDNTLQVKYVRVTKLQPDP